MGVILGAIINNIHVMNIKRSIKFSLNARSGKTKDLPIRMRITFKGNRLDFPIGYNLDSINWNEKEERVYNGAKSKDGSTDTAINKEIVDIRYKADNVFKRYELDEVNPDVEQIKDDLKAALSRKKDYINDEIYKEKNLLDYFDDFIKEMGHKNNWTDSTYEKFNSVRNHLSEFNPHLNINDFDEANIISYLSFLQDKKKMRNSTIKKQLGFLKWFLRWVDFKGYSTQRAYCIYKYKERARDNKKVIFLDWKELMSLYNLDIPESKKYMERVRDVFCFSCFTSLRYSDVYNLRRSDVKLDRIEITTIKTADSLVIELNKYSKSILDKYANVPFPDDKALPVISNQKMNDYLKELGEFADINEPIREVYYVGNQRKELVLPKYALLSTHCGRRTFICNMLAMGVSPQVVMEFTGHSDYKAMKPYIAVSEDTRKLAMKVFDEK